MIKCCALTQLLAWAENLGNRRLKEITDSVASDGDKDDALSVKVSGNLNNRLNYEHFHEAVASFILGPPAAYPLSSSLTTTPLAPTSLPTDRVLRWT